MVFYFTLSDPSYVCYMGRDKYENEELIRWGWPEDVWFHVDDHSSAHVYLRLKMHQTLDSIPETILEELAQLTKANSIEGCKLDHISIVYTMWSNLKKTGDMVDGQVRHITVETKDNEILKRLNKTKREENPDFRQLREERDKEERALKKKEIEKGRLAKEAEIKEKRKQAEEKSYKSVMQEEKMKSNAEMTEDYEDSFM